MTPTTTAFHVEKIVRTAVLRAATDAYRTIETTRFERAIIALAYIVT